MTQAPALPPVHMRRNGFDPVPELGDIRAGVGIKSVVNAFGMQVYLVTRHDDVKAMLSDHAHFANSRPPGFVIPGATAMPEEEQASARAGNLLGLDPPEHQRLRRMLTAGVHHPPDEAARAAHRRDRRRAPRRDGGRGPTCRPGRVVRTSHPVAGDLRATRGALRGSGRLPEAFRASTRPFAADSRAHGNAAQGPGVHAVAGGARPHQTRRRHPRHAGPRARRRTDRRRARRHRRTAAPGRPRDHVEHARARHARAAAAPRPAGRDARRPGRRRPGRRGTAALAVDRADVDPAHHHRRGRARRGDRSLRVSSSSRHCLRAIAIPHSPTHPTCSTSDAARQGIWRSVTACTTVSVRRWPAWRCASRGLRCFAGSPTLRSPRTSKTSSSGRSTSSTGYGRCWLGGDGR